MVLLFLTAITMAVSIIYLQSRNLQVQQEITNLNSQISDMQTDYDNAKQEVNELTSRDRIEQIAGNAGLTSQQDNIKTGGVKIVYEEINKPFFRLCGKG